MKNSTLIAIAALAACTTTVNAQQLRHPRLHTAAPFAIKANNSAQKNDVFTSSTIRKRRAAAKKSTPTYKPKTQTEAMYMDGEWMDVAVYKLSYDAKGRESLVDIDSEDGITRTEYTWTDDDQLATQIESTSEDEGATFVPSSKRAQTYDPILPQLTLTKDKYDWDAENNEWVENYDSFRRTIVRDADNNVTILTLAVPYNGNFDDTQRIANTFDPKTKQASSFFLEELQWDGTWEQSQYLHNLVWKKTNGQLVDGYDSWQSYGNYLLSATIGDYDKTTGNSTDFATIKVDYDANDGFTEIIVYTDILSKAITTKKFTDNNGSYDYEYKYYEDTNEDNVLNDNDLYEASMLTMKYDANGNVTLEEEKEYGINEETSTYEMMGGSRYVYTYDSEHDNALLTMQYEEYDSEAKEYVPLSRITTTEFVDLATGINNINALSASQSSAVYTLQGIKTPTVGKGLYIVKRNGKFVKVIK